MVIDQLKLEAQAAIDELMQEGRLPFNLEARTLVFDGDSQYTISFHDSRLRSITVTWQTGQPFKEIVRVAVLDRISRLSGRLDKPQR